MTRSAAVAATAFALAVGGGLTPLAGTAAAEPAPAPQEVVVPPPYFNAPKFGWPVRAEYSRLSQADSVGREGVFRYDERGKGLVQWTRYSDGTTLTVPMPADPRYLTQGTATDTLAFPRDNEIELRDPYGGVRVYPLPDGYTASAMTPKIFGSTVFAYRVLTRPDGTTTYEPHPLSLLADGTVRELTVTGLPGGTKLGVVVGGDDTSLMFESTAEDGTRHLVLVSQRTGRVEGVTPALPMGYGRVKLSPEHIAVYSSDEAVRTVLVGSRTAPSAPWAEVPVTTTARGLLHHLAVVGDWLVYRSRGGVEGVPIAGGPAVTLLTKATEGLASGPGGTAVATGTTGAGGDEHVDWGVQRITADASGKPVVTTLTRFYRPAHVQGITLTHGKLATVDDRDPVRPSLRERKLSATGTPTYGPSEWLTESLPVCSGDADLACAQLRATGDGRYLRRAEVDSTSERQGYFGTGLHRSSRPLNLATGSRIVDVNGDETVQYVPGAAGSPARQITYSAGQIVDERVPGAAALWNGRLWTAGTTNGVLTAKDLTTGRTVETVATGAPCVVKETQAAGRWLYWSCGAAGPAGVYDRTAKVSRPVPAGESLLGDGFVVTHDKAAGTLVLTGADPAHPVDRVVGELPATGADQRHVRWTVDRNGANLAYVDATERTHVVPTGIASQPLTTLGTAERPSVVDARNFYADLTAVAVSKPVGSWVMTVRHLATGAVHELRTGKDARGTVRVPWPGTDASGRLMPNGRYTWTLTATPADGVGPELRQSGDVALIGGASAASDTYQVMEPTRFLDTRYGTGVRRGKVGANGTVTLQVAGRGAVPSDATAVTLNLTVVNATANTFVTAYPAGTARPNASNVNVPAGRAVSNLVTVPVKDGKVTFANHAGSADLVADVSGYFTADTGRDRFQPLKPTRVIDTRTGLGAPKHKADDYHWPEFVASGTGGLPKTGVTAVLVHVTATGATKPTYVTAFGDRADGSTLTLLPGQTVSNLAVVKPGVYDDVVNVVNHTGAADVIVDLAGYYTSEPVGALFKPLAPSRSLDTRTGTGAPKGKLGAGRTVTLTVAGRGGVPATGATAVVMNVTATGASTGTYISAYPYGTPRPTTSNVNVRAGQTVSNLVVVPVKDGKVTLYNHAGGVDVIADIQGFYAP
ncbi:FlgD immunoglobulin-like domain containing protein [Streptomyces sp. NPDC090025]|uniref:FlgD immunoglobulin-like domain containing protein n=1 Tax=Streptomyces sp. NPDC090025 TaxID=3365922 RepID=UPI0038375FCF